MVQSQTEITGKPLKYGASRAFTRTFRLNEAGALNGQNPISAYIAFMTVAYSLLLLVSLGGAEQ